MAADESAKEILLTEILNSGRAEDWTRELEWRDKYGSQDKQSTALGHLPGLK